MSLSLPEGFYEAGFNPKGRTLIFPFAAPQAFFSGMLYPAECIALPDINSHLRHLRGEIPKTALHAATGVHRHTIQRAEAEKLQLLHYSADALYKGLGGEMLFLAFSSLNENPDDDQRALVLADSNHPSEVKHYFKTRCKQLGVSQPKVAQSVGVTLDSVRRFDETDWSYPETISTYFGAALNMQVEYCGIRLKRRVHSPYKPKYPKVL